MHKRILKIVVSCRCCDEILDTEFIGDDELDEHGTVIALPELHVGQHVCEGDDAS